MFICNSSSYCLRLLKSLILIIKRSVSSSCSATQTDATQNISPDLEWSGAPEKTKSLALIVHDPDAPVEHGWYHWIAVDIPVTATGVEKGAKFASPAREIAISSGTPGYAGPCPPVGHGAHHYHFTLYALDVKKIKLSPNLKPYEVEAAVKARAIAQTTLTGLYEKK